MHVLIGSMNRIKINAVTTAFQKVWPGDEWTFEGCFVSSGVSEQPLDEFETITGARNRIKAMRARQAHYYVGIEGGLIHSAGNWMECGWVVISNSVGEEGLAASAKMMIPERIYAFLAEGRTLTDACKEFFGVDNAGESLGYFGLMTNGAATRESAYTDAVAFALSRFAHPHVFQPDPALS